MVEDEEASLRLTFVREISRGEINVSLEFEVKSESVPDELERVLCLELWTLCELERKTL